MDYKELPLEERIQLASQYALLLTADNKSNEEIFDILKSDYALTDEQATQAFASMRSTNKTEYNLTVRGNFLKAVGLIVFCLLAFIVYYFMGKEMGSLAPLSWVVAFLFGICVMGAVVLMARIIWDKVSFRVVKKGSYSISFDQFDKAMASFAFVSLFSLCMGCYVYYTHVGIIKENEITTIHGCLLTEPVRHGHTGGKTTSYYYAFKFRGSNLEFRFFDYYYRYAKDVSRIKTIKKGDTVSVQIAKTDLPETNDPDASGRINLVNLAFNNVFFIDHNYRNARVNKSNQTIFYVSQVAMAVIILILLLKKLFQYLSYRKMTGN